MISESVIRAWYTPAEILALRNWLIAATIVNVMLLIYRLSLHFAGLRDHYPRYNQQLFKQS